MQKFRPVQVVNFKSSNIKWLKEYFKAIIFKQQKTRLYFWGSGSSLPNTKLIFRKSHGLFLVHHVLVKKQYRWTWTGPVLTSLIFEHCLFVLGLGLDVGAWTPLSSVFNKGLDSWKFRHLRSVIDRDWSKTDRFLVGIEPGMNRIVFLTSFISF